MALITAEQAMDHLRVYGDEYTADVALKLTQAEAHVLAYLKREPAGDQEVAIVQAAILEVLANIFYDRGDLDQPTAGPITPRVINALSMLRDPALA